MTRTIRRTILAAIAIIIAGNLVLQVPKWIAMRQIAILRKGGMYPGGSVGNH